MSSQFILNLYEDLGKKSHPSLGPHLAQQTAFTMLRLGSMTTPLWRFKACILKTHHCHGFVSSRPQKTNDKIQWRALFFLWNNQTLKFNNHVREFSFSLLFFDWIKGTWRESIIEVNKFAINTTRDACPPFEAHGVIWWLCFSREKNVPSSAPFQLFAWYLDLKPMVQKQNMPMACRAGAWNCWNDLKLE